jgi:NAD-dependent deacetylase
VEHATIAIVSGAYCCGGRDETEEKKMPSMSLEAIVSMLDDAQQVVVFSGAGLSADSGIPTFRDGATGLWNNVDPDEVASIDGFLRNPRRVWNWLLQLKHLVDDRRPNAGHQAIARLEAICAAKQVTVITQNIDGYHVRAGNEHVLEVHGTIHRVRCHRRCGFADSWDHRAVEPYPCPACGAPVRPDLVMFGEALEEEVFAAAEACSVSADIFFCVGTSFTVQPAVRLPMWAKSAGAVLVEVNPHPTPLSPSADYSIRSGASEFFAALCGEVEARPLQTGKRDDQCR